ncbi:MAG: hypothetical protein BWK76_24990 [Desulfobulbaceae bacterium A2]|nr:MAG: hypothetical protein BWK76_24990 [Desulfobulbaceae bacterium A2]
MLSEMVYGQLSAQTSVDYWGKFTPYANHPEAVDANGNQHRQTGSFLRTDGNSAAMCDVWFAVDKLRTVDKTTMGPDGEVAVLDAVAFTSRSCPSAWTTGC